jgi:hypothetical protein
MFRFFRFLSENYILFSGQILSTAFLHLEIFSTSSAGFLIKEAETACGGLANISTVLKIVGTEN